MTDRSRDDSFKKILDTFQTERNRLVEESFARAFSESDEVRLFFINEDRAYTDGRNIVVDPAFHDIYRDEECIKRTEEFLSWPGLVSASPWNALKMVCRGLTLHECLHLLYSNFPGNQFKDSDFVDGTKNDLKVIGNISNIIEDAYIEAVGASVYDNIEIYLMFNRVASALSAKDVESTAAEKFKAVVAGAERQIQSLIDYLDYMAGFLLYPMFDHGEPSEEIAEYVEKTKPLFLDGSVQGSPDDRYTD